MGASEYSSDCTGGNSKAVLNYRFLSGPGVGLENLGELRMRSHLVPVHGASHGFGNLSEIDPTIDEGFDSDLIGSV